MTSGRGFVVTLIQLFCFALTAVPAMGASPATSQAALLPTSQPTEPKLPTGALRRLGDLRFSDPGSRGGFFATDKHRFVSFGTELAIWDVTTGWEICRYKVTEHQCTFAAYFGPHQIAVACNGINHPSDILVLDEQTGGYVRRIDRPWTGNFAEFSASPDGSRFAVLTDHLLLCDGQSGQTLRDFGERPTRSTGFNFYGHRTGFSADGKTMVVMTFDGVAHVVDTSTGQDKSETTYPATLGVALSGDGKMLATIPDDHDLHLYDLATGQELPVPPVEVKFSPDSAPRRVAAMSPTFAASSGLLAYSCNGAGVTLIDASVRPIAPRRILTSIVAGPDISLSADGAWLEMGDGYARRRFVDTQTEKVVSAPSVNMGAISAMAVSPDGNDLLVGNQFAEIYRWDLQKGKLLAHRDRTTATDFNRGTIFSLNYFDHGKSALENGTGDMRIFDPATLATRRRLTDQTGDLFPHPVYSSNTRWSAVMEENELRFTDHSTGATTVLLHQSDQYNPANSWRVNMISPDGSLLFLANIQGARFMDVQTHKMGPVFRGTNTNPNSLDHLRFSPSSQWVIMKTGLTVGVYDARKLLEMPDPAIEDNLQETNTYFNPRQVPPAPVSRTKPLWRRATHNNFDGDCDFSSTSELTVIVDPPMGDSQGEITVCETRTGKPLVMLPMTKPPAVLASFVPRHAMLVTADRAGTVLAWDLKALLHADDQASPQKSQTDQQLWATLAEPDAAAAYSAGLELINRHQLIPFAQGLSPIALSDARGDSDHLHDLILALSAPVPADREKAHKELEALGPAAIDAVRDAIETHPGGELEDRLNDIAHVIGADDPSVQAPPAPPASQPVASPDTIRTARVIQLLDWCQDARAAEQRDRLMGVANKP